MKRRTVCTVAMLGALLLLAGQAKSAVMISDFDTGTYYGGTSGWFNYDGMPYFSSVAAPTGGTTNWLGVGPYQYYEKITAQNWAIPGVAWSDFLSNKTIALDIIVPGTGPNAWLPNNAAQSIGFELQEFGGVAGTVNFNPSATFNTSVKDTIIHVDVAYNPALLDPTATGYNLSLTSLNPGYDYGWDTTNNPGGSIPYAARFYVDNIALTPEPGSLGVLALAGVAAGLRRTRRGPRSA